MKISVDVSPNAGGSVEIEDSTSVSYPFTRTFKENSTILVEAKPEDGYEFVNWSGDVSGNENPLEITMEYHMTIVANFSRIKHTLTVEVDGSGHTAPIAGIHSYNEGATVSLTATPDSGWQFYGWNGKVVNPDSAIAAVIMDSDKNVTASFSQIMYALTMEVSGNGSTSPATGTYNYAEGTEISITANPDSGWQFDSWTDEVNDPNSAATTFTVNSDKSITANFSQTNTGIIGIIAGTIGAGLATFFATRRQKS